MTGPTASLALIVAGILLICADVICGARLFLGVAGSITALIGAAQLWRLPHTNSGLGLLLLGLIAFLIEARFETRSTAAVAGTFLLGLGFSKLSVVHSIHPLAAFSLTAILAGFTTWLLSVAKRGRRNKRLPRFPEANLTVSRLNQLAFPSSTETEGMK